MGEGVAAGKKVAKTGMAGRSSPFGDITYEEEGALEFEGCVAKTAPVHRFIDSMTVGSDLTVLDMWCAERLAIPLARKCRRVTALLFSREEYDGFAVRCGEEGTGNITSRAVPRDSDLASLGLGVHDVAITSWPVLVREPRLSTITLDRLARRRVYICTAVGDGPFDRRMYEAAGRTLVTGPSYTHVYYNLVHRYLGLMPGIVFLREDRSGAWKSPEDAVDAHRWMFPRMTVEEEERVRTYLAHNLVEEDGGWRFSYPRRCTWAIMWWEKENKRSRRRG